MNKRYSTAFKWLDKLNYYKANDEQNENAMPAENTGKVDNGDSSNKIKADAREIAEAYNMDAQRHGSERFADELYHSIIHLLDRHETIVRSEYDYLVDEWYRYKLQCEHYEAMISELMGDIQ